MDKSNLCFNAEMALYNKGSTDPKFEIVISIFTFSQMNRVEHVSGPNSQIKKLSMGTSKGDFIIFGHKDQSKAIMIKDFSKPR